MSIKKRQKRSALLAYIILAVGAVFMIIPFLWMVLTSFKTYRETVKLPIQWFPAEWNFDNYVEVLKQLDFLRYYRNTILVTVTTLVAMTLIASLAAYAFARMEFPGKNVIFALLLVVYMVPPQMTMIPKYMMITKLGWVDTLAGIVVPNISVCIQCLCCGSFLFRFRKNWMRLQNWMDVLSSESSGGLTCR